MSERVYMTHPKLPDQPIRVRPGGVQARKRAGWKVTDEPEPEPVEEPTAEATARPRRPRRAAPSQPQAEQPDTGTTAID